MTLNSIELDHLNLTVANFKETAAWYERVFGFRVIEEGMEPDGPWGVLRSGDIMLCIYESPHRTMIRRAAPDSTRFHQINHFAIRIADQQRWEETLKRENLETYYNSPVRYPHSHSWYVTDPTGYMIEVAVWDGGQVRFDT